MSVSYIREKELPKSFTSRVLLNVPTLRWGDSRECTFAGALAAALTITDYPYDYTSIMGLTALAFRVRWYQAFTGRDWCPSSSMGEGPEEIFAVKSATGWQ